MDDGIDCLQIEGRGIRPLQPEPFYERRIGKFKCSKCGKKWTDRDCKRNVSNLQTCRGKTCEARVHPDQLLVSMILKQSGDVHYRPLTSLFYDVATAAVYTDG